MNSRRDIPAANFVMHVTHCQRNLTLCKECGEPVPTSQQEEHFEEYHAKVVLVILEAIELWNTQCGFLKPIMSSVNEKNPAGSIVVSINT